VVAHGHGRADTLGTPAEPARYRVNRREEDRLTAKKSVLAALGLMIAALALVAAGCGGDDGGGAPEALPSSSCTQLEYEGDGDPDYILASDFPLQGSSRTQTEQIVAAIRYELGQREWKAGDYNIGYQSCDDATAQAGKWDSGKCSQNANAYAANDGVIGVIGTFNSGCAQIIVPVLNEAADGAIAMVSPANTLVCLTTSAANCESTEPDKYYPSGTRNYARVVAHDGYQGAAMAEISQQEGVKSVFILNDKESYGLGVATNYRDAAESLGIEIAGFDAWDPKATSYTALFNKVKQSGADAVFLGGLIDENGAQVIKDKVAVLGPNDGAVKLLAPDGFTTQATIDEAGEAAAGMLMSVAGQPIDKFTGAAKDFVDGLESGPLSGKAIDPYAIYGAQAAQVMLDAIAASDGSREDVVTQLFATDVQDGLLGSFTLNEEGDPQGKAGADIAVGVLFTIYKATTKLETFKTIVPKPETVAAAVGK
jgi:branched-chain amino acid transport system substrate-binding protein